MSDLPRSRRPEPEQTVGRNDLCGAPAPRSAVRGGRESSSTFTGQGRGRRSRTLRNFVRLFITPAGARAARPPRPYLSQRDHTLGRVSAPICFLAHHLMPRAIAFTASKFRGQIVSQTVSKESCNNMTCPHDA